MHIYIQDVLMHFHQMAYGPLDGGIQFFGVNMAASTFCATVFSAIALPDRVIIGGGMLGFSSVPTAAITAYEQIRKRRKCAVSAACIRPYGLHLLPDGSADNGRVPVLHIVLRGFALVDFRGFCKKVRRNPFLKDGIAHIFFILENAADGSRFPPLTLPRRGHAIVHQNPTNISAAFS